MDLRSESQVGFLMLQWLGVLVPGAFRREFEAHQLRRGSRRAGKTVALGLSPPQREFRLGDVVTYPSPEAMIDASREALGQHTRLDGSPILEKCGCCERLVPRADWDHIYGSCGTCAGAGAYSP